MKPKVGVFDFASCEGCELQIVNLEEDVVGLVSAVDVVSFREAMKEHSDDYDIAIVEGSITRESDEARQDRDRDRGVCNHRRDQRAEEHARSRRGQEDRIRRQGQLVRDVSGAPDRRCRQGGL